MTAPSNYSRAARRLTAETVRAIVADYDARTPVGHIAHAHGVSRQWVWKIVNGHVWQDVTRGRGE